MLLLEAVPYQFHLRFASDHFMLPVMKTRRSQCPIAFALDLFGDKWTLLIVRDIALHGRRHFGDFQSAGEGIATNILADRLRLLLANGIVERRPDPAKGSRRIYSMTDKGTDLLPLLVDMILWSGMHNPQSPVPASFLRRAESNREQLLEELRRKAQASR